MASYVSDYDKFLNEMREKHPEWAREQQEGLDLLWDRKVDPAEQKAFSEAGVKPRAYPYDVNFGGR